MKGRKEGRKESLEIPSSVYKSILADCQLRQVDVYSRFIAGFIRGRPGIEGTRRDIASRAATVTDCVTSLSSPLSPLSATYPT